MLSLDGGQTPGTRGQGQRGTDPGDTGTGTKGDRPLKLLEV